MNKLTFTSMLWKFKSGEPQITVSCDTCRMNMAFNYGTNFYDIFKLMQSHECPKVVTAWVIPIIQEDNDEKKTK